MELNSGVSGSLGRLLGSKAVETDPDPSCVRETLCDKELGCMGSDSLRICVRPDRGACSCRIQAGATVSLSADW